MTRENYGKEHGKNRQDKTEITPNNALSLLWVKNVYTFAICIIVNFFIGQLYLSKQQPTTYKKEHNGEKNKDNGSYIKHVPHTPLLELNSSH